jgi:hypothetical protein
MRVTRTPYSVRLCATADTLPLAGDRRPHRRHGEMTRCTSEPLGGSIAAVCVSIERAQQTG